ncbi:hypothetical protein [Estrella lausannensis]|uniref:Uncharacterized protein n=1 Tax=Estrella lausannensis TaxID=483423 RepID=A0A0H5E602_9BACT|nr:hypothetical protein [Estrella lausannensis]CRX38670.1 hypothetical protein ELAC_1331 [Estrella lausannensis]
MTINAPVLKNFEAVRSISENFEQLIQKPMVTTKPDWNNFFSFSGRAVTLVRVAEYAITLPFRIVEIALNIIYSVVNIFKSLATLPFNLEANWNNLKNSIYGSVTSITHAAILPLSVSLDIVKLALGVVVHPTIAIQGPATI